MILSSEEFKKQGILIIKKEFNNLCEYMDTFGEDPPFVIINQMRITTEKMWRYLSVLWALTVKLQD